MFCMCDRSFLYMHVYMYGPVYNGAIFWGLFSSIIMVVHTSKVQQLTGQQRK